VSAVDRRAQDALPEPRRFGTLAGQVRVADDFDAPLPRELAEAFGMTPAPAP